MWWRVATTLVVMVAGGLAQEARPNIIFIFSDDHAIKAVSAYEGALNRTPNIDRLATEGVLFKNAFCTNSICAPSRASVLTGTHSHINGQRTNRDRLDGAQFTFPKALQNAGYQTALIGKWHLKSEPTGFDHWDVLRGQGHYYNPDFINKDGRRRITGYATDVTTDLAIDWLDHRKKDKPFLLMCQHKAPHRTWAPAPRHLHLFEDVEFPLPTSFHDSYGSRSATLQSNEMSIANHFHWDYDLKVPGAPFPGPPGRTLKNIEVPRMNKEQRATWDAAYGPRNAQLLSAPPEGRELLEWKYQRYIKDYLRTVAAVDESVGRLLSWLRAHRMEDNTIVIYASDQGFYLGEHGWYDKRWMFEESLRMPFVMRWPRCIKPGQVSEDLVQNIDFAPTLLKAAGVDVPARVQGLDLLPGLTDSESGDLRDAIYYAYYEVGEHNVPRHEGVRTQRHKLMYFPDSDEWQLFDLAVDPNEMKSLHDDPSCKALLLTMKNVLLRERERYKANPWPLPGE